VKFQYIHDELRKNDLSVAAFPLLSPLIRVLLPPLKAVGPAPLLARSLRAFPREEVTRYFDTFSATSRHFTARLKALCSTV